jgi:uncharacterized protein (DUF2236 family)
MAPTTETTATPASSIVDTVLGAGLMAGPANVIMQLARPGVGYGVYESPVESGNVFRHPIKRNRTTLTYLAVATLGTEQEKKTYRKWINKSHARVRSTESSPVEYNAFDPELQLWVAACLYKGFEDIYSIFGRTLDDEARDAIYGSSATLGTTLQVRPEMWPANRAAFEEYWNSGVEKVRIDPTIRDYLYRLTTLRMFPAPIPALFGKFNLFVTTGFLPPRFREEMQLPWSERDQRRFELMMRTIGAVAWRLPAPLRHFPFNLYLWDMRVRIRLRLPLV